MGLNLEKLEMVRKLAGGVVQARCPACAESGADKTGNHLRIQPAGRFGCCVHPKDSDHRKRIFALAGVRDRQAIRVTVGGPKVAKIIQSDVLGRLGRVFATPTENTTPIITTGGTFRTSQNLYMCDENNIYTCKGYPSSVLNVLELQPAPDSKLPVPSVPAEKGIEPLSHAGEKLPYLTADGTLVIPFDSPERYHWWKPDGERQSVATTLQEVRCQNGGKLCR